MPRQLTFDMPSRPALGRDDFFLSPANAEASKSVSDPTGWPNGKLIVAGPKGSGKTHLVHVWKAETDARVVAACDLSGADVPELAAARYLAVEDIDIIAGDPSQEETLFHLHNAALASGSYLLMTTTKLPANAGFLLADLLSRLLATNVAPLHAPDDALLAVILVKLFSDRQLAIEPKIVDYLVSHMDRSFDSAQTLVAALDAAALSQKRAITKPLASNVLAKLKAEEP